ncbi:MAG: cytochrome c biogenesis protein CcdA [Gemmatimonadaceae bacterium]
MRARLGQLAALLLAASGAAAQERPVTWSLEQPRQPISVAAEARFRIPVAARIDTGWKLYSLTPQVGGPIATSITLGDSSAFVISGPISAPTPEEYPDRNFNIFTHIYTDAVRFVIPVRVRAGIPAGKRKLPVLVQFQTCTDRYCLPPRTDTLTVAVNVVAPTAASVATIAEEPPPPPPTTAAVSTPRRSDIVAPTDLASLARFLWLALTMGLLSLLTPCILPMIPITVGYFGRGASENQRSRSVAAFAHAAGIVVAFTGLGFAVSTFFGAGGIVRLAASPWLNLVIAALFIAFALNLMGVFEITLPQRMLSAITRAGDGGQRHAAGALLMGGAFAITSFTCTVPFVGTLLVLATQGTWRWPLLGLAAYGAAFALPFFLLALAPAAVQRLPRSGPWMSVLKWTFGIVELALAVKFLSNVDLVLGIGVLTREVVISLWVVGAVAIAAVFLSISRVGRPSVARLIGAGAAAFVAVWLFSGVRGKRLGELEAYLPPPRGAGVVPGAHARIAGELPWMHNDYSGALTVAAAERKPVLVDFTGYTCTNCRWMEANMFPRDEVRGLLKRYVRVRLFTDGLGEPYVSQQRFQLERFGSVALPYYVVLDQEGAAIATFLGMTRDSREFSAFLEKALSAQ